MRDERLLADRGKKSMRCRKLLPDRAIATLVEPVENRLYCFSLTRMMVVVIACLRRRVLMMVAFVAAFVASFMASVMLSTGLILRNERPHQQQAHRHKRYKKRSAIPEPVCRTL